MQIATILLVLSVTMFIISTTLFLLARKFSKRPHFFHNPVGGVVAQCSVSEFWQAKAAGSITANGKVIVPETIISSILPEKAPYVSLVMPMPWGLPTVRNDELFVPFASEAVMSYGEQAKIFTKPRDPDDFQTEKKFLNCQHDFYLSFVQVCERINLPACIASSMIATIIFGSAFSIIGGSIADEKMLARQVVLYTTSSAGVIHESVMTRREMQELPMGPFNVSSADAVLYRGRVSEIQPIGGGVVMACILQLKGKIRCGFASSVLRISDEAFVRTGNALSWSSGDKSSGYHVSGNWLISSKEAAALMTTGKFTALDE